MKIKIKRIAEARLKKVESGKISKTEKQLRRIATLLILDICIWGYVIDTTRTAMASATLTFVNPPIHEDASQAPQVTATEAVDKEINGGLVEGEIERKIRSVFGEHADRMIKIAKCESQLQSHRIGDTDLTFTKNGKEYGKSYGIFQVRHLEGRPEPSQLLDPMFNIEYAKKIFDSQGLNAWYYCSKRV